MQSRRCALAVVPLLWLAVPVVAGVPLVDPPPVSVPAGMPGEHLARAIKAAFVEKGWVISTEQPGRIEATLNIRKHTARVAALYDASSVQLQYIDSDNLDFEEKKGQREIHRNYPKWVNNIVLGIQRNLLLMSPSS